MAYCVNPACPNPENLVNTNLCQACGSKLLLQDKYEVIQTLGQGGFGATFIAKNIGLPGCPQCVIKQLRPNATAASVLDMARDLFRREAKTLGKIGSHPQIPTLLDYFEQGTEFYLVQEFISGLTLQQEVKDNGPFPEAGVRQFLSEILPLIQYIHSQQVIHRDIKPANIIRRNQDRKLVLIDFGAVKDQVNPNVGSLSEQTALTSYAIGTPGYAPPEQMAMRPVYSSDIYALGVTCIYLLTGKSPKDLNYNPATGEMNWLSTVDVSDSFAQVMLKMLEVSVKHRYQTANEVLKALDMEPYLESLAQSMIKPTPGADKTTGQTKGVTRWQGASGSGGSRNASPGRMADSIRARRNRSPGDTTQVFTSPSTAKPRRPASPTSAGDSLKDKTRSSGGERVKPPKRLTPAQVQQIYAKGNLDFASHDLSNQDFQRFNLVGANLHSTRLEGANLCNADLSETNLGRTNLCKAALRDAKLVRAYMNYTDLIGADLRGADLSYAHMSNANLRGANLSGANLTGAKVNEDQLALAKLSWNTVMPNGKRNGLW